MKATIDLIVRTASMRATSDLELAVMLHDVVRDRIAFGFTPWFDHASSSTTLRIGVGHCNPQSRLMVELFRRAAFRARYQPVTITNDILHGVASTPRVLSHLFTEVDHGAGWCRLDSYIVDPPLRSAAVQCLRHEGRQLGYGCHVLASDWSGHGDAYSQIATPDQIVETHPAVDDLDDFYRTTAFRHRLGPIPFSSLLVALRPLGRVTSRRMSAQVASARLARVDP